MTQKSRFISFSAHMVLVFTTTYAVTYYPANAASDEQSIREEREDLETSDRRYTPGGGFNVGGILGAASVNDGVGTSIPLGLTVSYRPRSAPLMVGMYFLHLGLGQDSTAVERGELNFWGGELNYALSRYAGGLQVGARIGPAFENIPTVGTYTHASFGPKLGYDYLVSPYFSLGAEVAVMVVTTNPILTTPGANVTAKVWF